MMPSDDRTAEGDATGVRCVTRRRFLQALATGSLTLTGSVVLAACSSPPAASNATASTPPSAVAQPSAAASTAAAQPSSVPATQAVDVELLTAGWPLEPLPAPEDQAADPAKRVYAETIQEWLSNNPGVTIGTTELNIWDQQALVTALSGGVGPSWFPGYVLGGWNVAATRAAFSQGLAADVNPLVEQYQTQTKLADYVKPHLDFLKLDGKFYGVPESYGAGNGVYFRRDMIEAKGLKEPIPGWTWNDFYELAKGLTGDGIKGSAMQSSGLGRPISANQLDFLAELPTPQTSWNWTWNYTSNAGEWERIISAYRKAMFEDQSLLSDVSFRDPQVAKAFSNNEVGIAFLNSFFMVGPPTNPETVSAIAESLNKSVDEVVGFVAYPVGDNGGPFGGSQAFVSMVSFSPDLDASALDKAYSLYDYMYFGDGYVQRKVGTYEATKDPRYVFTDITPVNGMTTYEGVPGSAEETWGKRYMDAIRDMISIPLLPNRAAYIPAETNAGPTNDLWNAAISRWSYEAGQLDIAADLQKLEADRNQQNAGFTSSVADPDFVEGAKAYFAARDAFWKEHAPEFHADVYSPWYQEQVLPALNT
jgi:ABC-type glycerol-3-phosphate transport system substrate-binding protein